MDIFLLRQILFLSVTCLQSVSIGIVYAFPSVLIPAMLFSNTREFEISSVEASWIYQSNGSFTILGFFIFSLIFQIVGRKAVMFTMNALIIIGWIIIYTANSVTLLILGRLVQGLNMGGVYLIAMMIGEYSDNKRRGYFVIIKEISLAAGSLVCLSLGHVMGWRQIVIIGAINVTLSSCLLLLFSESPAFLAMKGRFDESKEAFYWQFGDSEEKKRELEELICAQTKRLEVADIKKTKKEPLVVTIIQKLVRKDFRKPFYIVVLSSLAFDASGRLFLQAIIPELIFVITGDTTTEVCSSAADILFIMALCMSCVVLKIYNRRTILFSSGSLIVILMFSISLLSYFGSYNGMNWVTASLILFNGFVTYLGLVPVINTIYGEIFPLENKGVGSLVAGVIFSNIYFIPLKLTPVMIDKIKIGGIFAVYGSCVLFSLFILYFILPETKDRSLQDIENEIKGITSTSDTTDVELNLLDNK